MQITLLGKRWKLHFLPLGRFGHESEVVLGMCDPPNKPHKEIRVDSRLKDQELLEVLLHEMLHAVDWHQSEEIIASQAHDIAKVLWKLGYRQNE